MTPKSVSAAVARAAWSTWGRRPGGDERESAQRDQGDTPPAQAAGTRALTSARAPSSTVPHRHRLRILVGRAKAAAAGAGIHRACGCRMAEQPGRPRRHRRQQYVIVQMYT